MYVRLIGSTIPEYEKRIANTKSGTELMNYNTYLEEAKDKALDDPNSKESKFAQTVAKRLNLTELENASAREINKYMGVLGKAYSSDVAAESRQQQAQAKMQQAKEKQQKQESQEQQKQRQQKLPRLQKLQLERLKLQKFPRPQFQ